MFAPVLGITFLLMGQAVVQEPLNSFVQKSAPVEQEEQVKPSEPVPIPEEKKVKPIRRAAVASVSSASFAFVSSSSASSIYASSSAAPSVASSPEPAPTITDVPSLLSQLLNPPVESYAVPVEEVPDNLVKKSIRIYLGIQRAYLIENGNVIKTYQISSGAPLTPTPTGSFQVYEKNDLRISGLGTPYRMAKYMAFTPSGSHGLHALPYLGNIRENSIYWREARAHIGIPVSHGCIRFLPEEADEIYTWADIGTPVIIEA